MTPLRIGAFVLVLLGALGLVYGKITYTKDRHDANIGPLKMTVKENESIEIPKWLGAGAVVLGGLVLLVSKRR